MAQRYRQALVPTAILALVALLVPIPLGHSLWVQTVDNAAHAPLFAGLAWLWMAARGALRRDCSLAWRDYVTVWVTLVLAGLVSEVAQRLTGRDASVLDLANDALGAGVALGALALWRREHFVSYRWSKVAVMVILSLAALSLIAPVAWTVAAYHQRREQFPVLWQYRSPLDLYFFPRHNRSTARDRGVTCNRDTNSLPVSLTGSGYPGITLDEPYPDWRGFETLLIRLGNPGPAPLTLTVRVHDAEHSNRFDDRFNRSFTLPPLQESQLRFALADIQNAPATRQLDLSRIAGVILFRAGGGPDAAFCLTSIALAR